MSAVLQIPRDIWVHPLAHVDDTVAIGSESRVWQFASIIRGAVVGAECVIGANATIDGARLGDRCHIGSGACLAGYFVLGDDVFIGPNATFCNDRWPSVEKEGFDLAWLRENPSIRIEEFASIGANAVILPGVTVGRHALVAAGAVVTESVPAGTVYGRDGKTTPKPEGWRRWRMVVAR